MDVFRTLSETVIVPVVVLDSILGDFNRVTVSDVEKLANGDGSGRVER